MTWQRQLLFTLSKSWMISTQPFQSKSKTHTMSDDKQPPKPPAPMKRTSAVPLKKETVRVSLKAEPSQTGPPPAPAPTIPLQTASVGGPPSPSGAPAPAPTIPLKTQASTVALSSPGGTQPLPQATVQLQNTQPLGAPTAPTAPQMGTISTTDVDDEESDTIPTITSILAFVLALAIIAIGIMTWTSNDINEIGDLFS